MVTLLVCVTVCILFGNHKFNPSISEDGQIKIEPRLERVSVLSAHLLGNLRDIHSSNIFMSSLWVA